MSLLWTCAEQVPDPMTLRFGPRFVPFPSGLSVVTIYQYPVNRQATKQSTIVTSPPPSPIPPSPQSPRDSDFGNLSSAKLPRRQHTRQTIAPNVTSRRISGHRRGKELRSGCRQTFWMVGSLDVVSPCNTDDCKAQQPRPTRRRPFQSSRVSG